MSHINHEFYFRQVFKVGSLCSSQFLIKMSFSQKYCLKSIWQHFGNTAIKYVINKSNCNLPHSSLRPSPSCLLSRAQSHKNFRRLLRHLTQLTWLRLMPKKVPKSYIKLYTGVVHTQNLAWELLLRFQPTCSYFTMKNVEWNRT